MKKIDPSRLSHVVKKDGKIVARCPACAAQGKDAKGNNFVLYADGGFGCQAYPQSKEHNREILKLAGVRVEETRQVEIHRVHHPPSQVIKAYGHLGREKTPASKSGDNTEV